MENRTPKDCRESAIQCRRKANRHWEMAGLSRQDGDYKDSLRHTKLARAWDQKAVDLDTWYPRYE